MNMHQQNTARTNHQQKEALPDAVVCEMLFATGIRISELCSLKVSDVDLEDAIDLHITLHVVIAKQRDILTTKHPRMNFNIH